MLKPLFGGFAKLNFIPIIRMPVTPSRLHINSDVIFLIDQVN